MCDQQSLRSACAYTQSDQSLCLSLVYYMSVKLLTEHHLEFLSLKGGCTGSSETALVKAQHCWKSRHGSNSIYPVVGHGLLIHPLRTGNPYMGIMTNIEDPDEKTAFHQGLHCLLSKNRSTEKKYIITCNPAIYITDHPDSLN